MDVKTYVNILRLHSEQLQQLSGQLTQRLTELEQALSEQHLTTYPEAHPLIEGLSNLSMNVSDLADILNKRILAFIEKTKGATTNTFIESQQPTISDHTGSDKDLVLINRKALD